MNTRLQVEHPVTEMVSGIDLVAEQIRVGVGRAAVVHARTTSTLARPRHRGARQRREPGRRPVPARRPAASPSSSPPQGFGVRWDGGYEAGDEVSQFYDNLVGKLIVWGQRSRHRDRAHAAGARASSASRASPRRSRPTSPSSSTPTSPPATHSTKWVEDVLDLSGVDVGARRPPTTDEDAEPKVRRDVDVEVNGRATR